MRELQSVYSAALGLLAEARKAEVRLPEEERERRREERKRYEEARIRKAQIIKNICPDCEGRLIRGKKNKRNDYKRDWNCINCGNRHSL